MKTRRYLIIFLILSLFGAACAARQAEAPMSEPGFAPEPVVMFDEGIASDSTNRYSLGGETSLVEPLVIRHANLTLVVDDPGVTADEIGKMADRFGGFVVSSNVFQSSSDSSARIATRASVSIRVPVDRLDEALEQIQEDAIEVREKRVTGEDVTQQYTDLESRLRNLEAAEKQLLVIMDNAFDTENVLRVFDDLRLVREDIEIIKGQMNYFEDSARMSLISVELIPDELAQPLEIGGWRPEGTAKQAVETLIQTLQFFADAGIWIVICILPIGLLLGVPGFIIGQRVVQRRKSKEGAAEEASTEQSEE